MLRWTIRSKHSGSPHDRYVPWRTPDACELAKLTPYYLGVFIANAEGSIVLATYSRIASDFNSLSNASWLATSYVLAMSVAMPMYGKLSDIFGRSILLIVASALFALGKYVAMSPMLKEEVLMLRSTALSGVYTATPVVAALY